MHYSVRGLLKGFDVMSNLVLDEAEEFKCGKIVYFI